MLAGKTVKLLLGRINLKIVTNLAWVDRTDPHVLPAPLD
jgi:hypothetical protein